MISLSGTPVAELSVVKVNGDGTIVPAQLLSRESRSGRKLETWSVSEPPINVLLEYTSVRSPAAMKVGIRAANRSSEKASACIALEASLKYTVDRATLFDFTKSPYVEFQYDRETGIASTSWKAETDQNFRAGLYGFPNRRTIYNAWGTVDLCNPQGAGDPMSSTLYLPVVSLFEQGKGGLVAWCDPRSAFGFDGNARRLRLQHTFFLPAGEGAEDTGFEPGDGTGPWPYEVYFGYSKYPSWDQLYADFFMPSVPDLRGGKPAKSDPGMVALQRLTEDYVPIFRRLGIKCTGGVSITYQHTDGPTLEEVEWGRKLGVESFAKDGTIAMLIELDVSPVPFWEPMWVWERYKSSLVKHKDGTEWISGQGKYGNPSLILPYGRDRLKAMRELFDGPFGGFYTDLYLSTVGSDWGHPVDALPFYPMQRAFYEYLGAIGQETKTRGLLHVVNAPHPSCLVGKYADWMTFDTDAPIWLWCRAYGEMTGINVQFWTNLQGTIPKLRSSMSDALAYGIVTGPYVIFGYLLPGNTPIPDADKEPMLALYERHYRVAYEVGRAKLVKGTTTAGRPGPILYYKGAAGSAYITVQNTSRVARDMAVPLDIGVLGLDRRQALKLSVWDIDSDTGKERALDPDARTHTLRVQPGMTSVIRIRPV